MTTLDTEDTDHQQSVPGDPDLVLTRITMADDMDDVEVAASAPASASGSR